MNMPIYRAKKIDSKDYVFGVPRQDSKGFYEMIIDICEDDGCGVIQRFIDPTTLAIHFPDMLDSEGNKIFASLQKNGKGGDKITYNAGNDFDRYIGSYIFNPRNKNYSLAYGRHWENDAKESDFYKIDAPSNNPINTVRYENLYNIKVIGIQE